MRALALLIALALATTATALPRDAQQKQAFRKQNPCPVNGTIRGPCPGWQIDHRRALMNGGRDHPSNMQWLATDAHGAKTLADRAACKKSVRCKHKRLAKKRRDR